MCSIKSLFKYGWNTLGHAFQGLGPWVLMNKIYVYILHHHHIPSITLGEEGGTFSHVNIQLQATSEAVSSWGKGSNLSSR